MMKKTTLIITIIISCVIVIFIALFLFVFKNDEFATVNIIYTGENMDISKDPENFTINKLSHSISINAIWRNESDEDCKVIVSSADGNDEFILKSGQEYGSFLPKVDEIKIKFCSLEKNIKM